MSDLRYDLCGTAFRCRRRAARFYARVHLRDRRPFGSSNSRVVHRDVDAYPFPFTMGGTRLSSAASVIVATAPAGRPREIARAFQRGMPAGLVRGAHQPLRDTTAWTPSFRPGVSSKTSCCSKISDASRHESLRFWINHAVPPNDGGISLGQAALAAFGQFDRSRNHDEANSCMNFRSR